MCGTESERDSEREREIGLQRFFKAAPTYRASDQAGRTFNARCPCRPWLTSFTFFSYLKFVPLVYGETN